jgi:hypothetical protein
MLVRFTVSNFLSFRESTEFNMLTGNPRRLEHHVYEPVKGLELLKMAAVYGANGAGKSNLVKAMLYLRELVVKGWLSPGPLQFKLDKKISGEPTTLEVEFICNGVMYVYGVDLSPVQIIEEWLYRSMLSGEDELVFHRRLKAGTTSIEVAPDYRKTEEEKIRVRLYEKEILKDTVTLLQTLGESKAEFGPVHDIFNWFGNFWGIVLPQSQPKGIIRQLTSSPEFFIFAKELMCTFHTGIQELDIETYDLDAFFGADDAELAQKIKTDLEKSEASGGNLVVQHQTLKEELFITRNADGQPVVKRLIARHSGSDGRTVPFAIWQESDGTRRLLDLLPAFYKAVQEPAVVVIDEIERTIHPLLLKELISKFARDTGTKGQLIFTTHEAYLLDQETMRQDEFWFAEKSSEGATSLIPLSDFKDVRYDLDLRKGYLLGRFRAIPFTGDLRHLKWDAYAEAEHQ